MIPLRDVIPSRTTPWVTLALIGLNALIFAYGLALEPDTRTHLFFAYGLVPFDVSWTSPLTSLFLHSGWLHLGGNLLALWIFGDNVEDRMGHGRFLGFYLLSGLTGALAGWWTSPGLPVPIVGAGAAVAGVIGAYFVLFPHSRILMLVPLVVRIDVIEAPALIVAAFWAVLQIAGDGGRLVVSSGDSAFILSSHLAGGLAGVLAVWVFRRPERLSVEWWTDRGQRAEGRGQRGGKRVTG